MLLCTKQATNVSRGPAEGLLTAGAGQFKIPIPQQSRRLCTASTFTDSTESFCNKPLDKQSMAIPDTL